MSFEAECLVKTRVMVQDGVDFLNVAVLKSPKSISVGEFLKEFPGENYIVYTDENGIHRIAHPEITDRGFKGNFWVPGAVLGGLFGFRGFIPGKYKTIETGSRSKDVRHLVGNYTFVGLLDCVETMKSLYVQPGKQKAWILERKTILTVYFLTVKAAPFKAVSSFLSLHEAVVDNKEFSLESIAAAFGIFQEKLDDALEENPSAGVDDRIESIIKKALEGSKVEMHFDTGFLSSATGSPGKSRSQTKSSQASSSGVTPGTSQASASGVTPGTSQASASEVAPGTSQASASGVTPGTSHASASGVAPGTSQAPTFTPVETGIDIDVEEIRDLIDSTKAKAMAMFEKAEADLAELEEGVATRSNNKRQREETAEAIQALEVEEQEAIEINNVLHSLDELHSTLLCKLPDLHDDEIKARIIADYATMFNEKKSRIQPPNRSEEEIASLIAELKAKEFVVDPPLPCFEAFRAFAKKI